MPVLIGLPASSRPSHTTSCTPAPLVATNSSLTCWRIRLIGSRQLVGRSSPPHGIGYGDKIHQTQSPVVKIPLQAEAEECGPILGRQGVRLAQGRDVHRSATRLNYSCRLEFMDLGTDLEQGAHPTSPKGQFPFRGPGIICQQGELPLARVLRAHTFI